MAKAKVQQIMKKKKMHTSLRLQQMLLDLDINDKDCFLKPSISFGKRISALERFGGGIEKWSKHLFLILSTHKKNSRIEFLTLQIL